MKVTKKQLNLIIENYLNEADTLGIGSQISFDFKNACDFSDIEATEGFKKLKEFNNNRKVKGLSSEIRALEKEIEQRPPTGDPSGRPLSDTERAAAAAEDQVTNGLLSQLEQKKREFSQITDDQFGILGGIINTPMFQSQLLQVASFGALLTFGPAANMYCNVFRSIVKVINKALGVYVEKEDKTDKEVTEFDFFYTELSRITTKIKNKQDTTAFQDNVWSACRNYTSLTDNQQILFDFIYVPFVKSQIPTRHGLGASPTREDIAQKVKDEARKFINYAKRGNFKLYEDRSSSSPIKAKEKFKNKIAKASNREELQSGLLSYGNIRRITFPVPNMSSTTTWHTSVHNFRNISSSEYTELSKKIIDTLYSSDQESKNADKIFENFTRDINNKLAPVPG